MVCYPCTCTTVMCCVCVCVCTPGPCVEYHVNANLLSCKTTEQWEKVGDNQCKLRGEQTHSMLTNTQVSFPTTIMYHYNNAIHTQVLYKCHSMSLERKYLRATFTCCSTHTTVPPSPPKDSQVSYSLCNVLPNFLHCRNLAWRR